MQDLKLTPLDPKGCSTAGFKTDADALSLYKERGTPEAVLFIKNYLRYNAIKTYLKTFIEGIEKNLDYSDRNTSTVYAMCYKYWQTIF